MPLLLETETRVGTLVRAVNDILLESGPAGLTIRNISRVSGVHASSIYHQMGNREHLLRVAAHRTARARIAALRSRSTVDGVLAFLPEESEDVLDTRAWLAWLELWRVEESLERVIRECREDERAFLARVLDFRLAGPDLDALTALIDGLRVAICAPRSPMRREHARAILATRCHTWLDPRVPLSDTPPRRTA